jgi:hypothetical protein
MSRSITDLVPTAGPVPSPFGILSPAATVVEDSSVNWLDGFTYEIGDARVSIKNRAMSGGSTASVVVVAPNDSDALRTYYPFVIESDFHASNFALTPENIEARAAEALAFVTQKAVEREFWNGDIAKTLTASGAATGNRYLASTSAIDITPTPGTGLKARAAQALLEEALGNATVGSAGVIHTSRAVASILAPKYDDDATTLKTAIGNNIVAGSGYSNLGPTGFPATGNYRWMYATGPVTVRLGPIDYRPLQVSQAVDIRQNTTEYTASRAAAVTWSTSNLYAVLVDLSLDYA